MNQPGLNRQAVLTRIAIGSCVQQNRPAPIWEAVLEFRPQVFVMMGDNIYGDTEDMQVLRAKYQTLAAQVGFARLRQSCPLLAVWDDHDYGVNDGGSEYPRKVESQQIFNEFFAEDADSPRRQRPGIYDAVIVGPPGRRVQFILLDTRYFRSRLQYRAKGAGGELGPYVPTDDPDASVLGPAQWKWLEQQLQTPAEIRLIVSSIQVISCEHGWETWGNFPLERQRLFELIRKCDADGAIFLSGDRHLAELSRITREASPTGYALYDLTSSSLNQPSGGGNESEPNRYRLGDHYLSENFGSIRIDWDGADPLVQLAIQDKTGRDVRLHALNLSDLQRN